MKPTDIDPWVFDEQTARRLAANYSYNSAANWQRIREEAREGPIGISSLTHVAGTPAVVVGCGPSLDEAAPLLSRFDGAVFCGPSATRVLAAHEVDPTYLVVVDSHAVTATQLTGSLSNESIMLTHQAIAPEVLETWTARRRYWRLDIDGSPIVRMMYPWLRRTLSVGGCVVNACVQLAHWLGYAPIYLVGVDYGFPAGRTRCTEYELGGTHRYQPIEAPQARWELEEAGVGTTAEMMSYKLSLLAIWRMSGAELYSASRGILIELPHVDIADVIDDPRGRRRELVYPHAEIHARCDDVLGPYGIYVRGSRVVRPAALYDRLRELEHEMSLIETEAVRWTRDEHQRWTEVD